MTAHKIVVQLVLTNVLLWLGVTNALTIDQVFNIKWDVNAAGGCKDQKTTLSIWWVEAELMLQAGEDMFKRAAEGDKTAAALIAASYGSDPAKDLTARRPINAVQAFMRTEQPQSDRPWFFCNSEWLERQKETQKVFRKPQTVGEKYVPIERGVKTTEEHLVIKDHFRNLLYANGAKNVPYYSRDLEVYIFTEEFKGGDFCAANPSTLAVTQEITTPKTITFCLRAFARTPLLPLLEPTIDSDLVKLLPKSSTLLHELFHLVLGNAETPDGSYDYLVLKRGLLDDPNTVPEFETLEDSTSQVPLNERKFSRAELVRRSPESSVFYCLAAYCTTNFDGSFATGKWVKTSRSIRRRI